MISKQLEVLEMSGLDGNATVEQLAALPIQQWRVLSGNPNMGTAGKGYWFRGRINVDSDFRGFLEFDRPHIASIHVIWVETDPNGVVNVTNAKMGSAYPFKEWGMVNNYPSVAVEASAGSPYKFLHMGRKRWFGVAI